VSADTANTIYYTLSTISQTLAGALAVLVAFVVLRVQQCDTALANGEQWFFSNVKNDRAAWRVNLEHGIDQVVERFKIPHPVEHHIQVACAQANVAWHTRRQVITRLRVSLGLTLPTIGLCIIALPFTPRLASERCIGWAVLASAVLLTLGCLAAYASLILSIATQAKGD
jgi:hypothetical protein